MNLAYESARHWVDAGYPIIPVGFKSKRPLVNWEEFQGRLPSETELRNWFYSPFRNLGLITGNGLVVIDFDVQAVFDYWLPGFLAKFPQGTYMVKTRRGVHVYLHTEQPAHNCHSQLLDIKAERGYVLIPPSIHPSGFEYHVLSNAPILRIDKLGDVLGEEFTPEPEPVQVINVQPRPQFTDPFDEADAATEMQSRSIAEIRQRVGILDLLRDAEPSRPPRLYVAHCPFHEDANPSMWIDTERGLCGCWTCNVKEMDVINLFARINNMSNSNAIKELSRW